MQAKTLLLVLDNCEHLLSGCTRLAGQILARTPTIRILATSRKALRLQAERVVQLSGLPYPPDGYGLSDPQGLLQFDSVRLFVERARSVSPKLLPTSANAASLAQICRRLDGLPLALELAGARCNVITLCEIAQRLDDRFHLLTAAGREEHPPRHQTLRAASIGAITCSPGPVPAAVGFRRRFFTDGR